MKYEFAEVIVDIASEKLDRPFVYHIPEELATEVSAGSVVRIPFGSREITGYVVGLKRERPEGDFEIRDILEIRTGTDTAEEHMLRLAVWMSGYYGSTTIQALKTCIPIRKRVRSRKKKDAVAAVPEPGPADTPNEAQQAAVEAVYKEWENSNRTILINGVTGSGKTLVYTELIDRILGEGRQAIVLIPEIALTRQTVARFIRRFGNRVSFLHSRLSNGERYDQMKAARNGDISVMVGPRSALFTPFPKLGLIIIDEEHETSYHSESMPRYQAHEVAEFRVREEDAHLVLGSATPSLESAWRARQGEYLEIRLPNRYGNAVLPETRIIDMRAELASGNRSILSEALQEEIADRLEKKEQVMLFLNRRGYSGAVSCRSCGEKIGCPHCDVSLVRHRNGKLICHYCGYERDDVTLCPNCGSPYIGGMSVGTEMVEEIVRNTFPKSRVLRMDSDTTKGKDGHVKILERFASGKADILIGTQMIVKGHDFPNVTLVGVLLADLSLNSDDYRASERTYGLITQAVGRAGRAQKKGLALIQTYQPEHFAVKAAAAQDYEAFYKEETEFRSLMAYPPCGQMCAIFGFAEDEEKLTEAMGHIRSFLKKIDPENVLYAIGPAPMSVGKVADRYRQVIYLRNRDRDKLVKARELTEEYVAINSGFSEISIQYDFHC